MTSFVDTPVAQDPGSGFALREVMMAERQAYEVMRSLVPDLALPRERRRPLTERQQAAVEHYQELRDRLEKMRDASRSPGRKSEGDQSD